jgi:uncharacterized protein (DUF2147 family)
VLGLWLAMLVPAAAGSGRALLGVWQHPENQSLIEVYPCQRNRLCIKIVEIGDGQRTDTRNPDPALRSRPIIGLVIVNGAEAMPDDRWAGRLYNRNDGRYYDGYLAPAPMERLALTGCVMMVLCRTVIWQRPQKRPPA